MVSLILQIIIVLLVAGFIYWAATLIINNIAWIGAEFKKWIHIIITILIAAIILFYAIIPLLQALGRMNFGIH